MKRRLNYTKRRQLLAAHVAIYLLPSEVAGGRPSFSMTLEVPHQWKLRPDARVYVEPYVKSTSMRFDFGMVAATTAPENTTLSDVDPGSVLFRIKIVDESAEVGLLLASADAVRPREREEGAERRSILPLRNGDLGNQMWKVVIGGEGPELVINNRISGLRERLLSEPLLQGLVFPAALRDVLQATFGDGEYGDQEWSEDWYGFLVSLGVAPLPERDEEMDADQIDSMINDAIRRFCDVQRFGEKARAILEESLDG